MASSKKGATSSLSLRTVSLNFVWRPSTCLQSHCLLLITGVQQAPALAIYKFFCCVQPPPRVPHLFTSEPSHGRSSCFSDRPSKHTHACKQAHLHVRWCSYVTTCRCSGVDEQRAEQVPEKVIKRHGMIDRLGFHSETSVLFVSSLILSHARFQLGSRMQTILWDLLCFFTPVKKSLFFSNTYIFDIYYPDIV